MRLIREEKMKMDAMTASASAKTMSLLAKCDFKLFTTLTLLKSEVGWKVTSIA